VSDKWLPVSPASGRLDAFEWKVPLADLSPPGRVIEQGEEAQGSYPARDEAPHHDAPAPAAPGGAPPRTVPRREAPLPAVPARAGSPPPRVDGVIPLVHSPDDPGPDAELVAEPAPEPPTTPDGWSRLRGLFR
jgi:HemY protein